MSLKVILLINFIVFYGIEQISGVCEIQFPTEYSKRPTVAKMIGSRLVNIPDKLSSSIHFQDGEVIRLHCNTTFISPTSYNGHSTIDINCHNERLSSTDYSTNIMLVECDATTWNMYESPEPFSWCPRPKASYVIAKPNFGNDFLFLTSICYSFEDMSVQSLHYYMTPKSSQYSHEQLMREYKPGTKISYIKENFISRGITPSMYDNPQIKHWIEFAKYESHSLIQESVIYRNSDIQLGGLLDIIWWSGLRLGSWQLYEEALRQHIEAEDIEYDIIAGISGTVAAPIYRENCDDTRKLVEIIDDMDRTIPLYVWHYLKSTRHQNENIVIIGVNSPFYEFYSSREIVFCRDICYQIEWLQRVYATIHYRTLGVIFCCAVDEVKQSNVLNGFPDSQREYWNTTLEYKENGDD